MKIVDFAKQRGADPDTITRYIKRHPEPFVGHLSFDGNKMVVDDIAVKLLEEKYPLPAPVEVIKDTKSQELLIIEQKKVQELQERLMTLQEQLHENQLLIADQKGQLLRLEDKSKENDGLKKQVESMTQQSAKQAEIITQHAADLATAKTSLEYTEKELEAERQRLEEEKHRTAEVEEELARMKSAGWWKRLRRKW